jgi:hypothetical protein
MGARESGPVYLPFFVKAPLVTSSFLSEKTHIVNGLQVNMNYGTDIALSNGGEEKSQQCLQREATDARETEDQEVHH